MKAMAGFVAVGLLAGAAAQGQQKCDTCSMPSVSATPAAPAAPAVPDPMVAELEKLDADRDRAALAGDKEAVSAMLAEDMISLDESESVLDRADVVKRVRKGPASMKFDLQASDVRVRLLGDSAVVTARKKQTWELNGRPDSRTFRETNVYVRRAGRWLLAVSQRSAEFPPYAARDVAFDLAFDPEQALGDKAASVVLYEYSDYECPFCRKFAAETLARVEKDYVSSGRVALVFRNYPLEMHPHAFGAAVAGECAAAQGKMWAMNGRLMTEPAALEAADLARDAREVGLDPHRFARCVDDPATAEKIRRGIREGAALGIGGTPMFVIGVREAGQKSVRAIRMIEGAYPYEVFRATLDGVLRARGL